jgi:hypothetical protein
VDGYRSAWLVVSRICRLVSVRIRVRDSLVYLLDLTVLGALLHVLAGGAYLHARLAGSVGDHPDVTGLLASVDPEPSLPPLNQTSCPATAPTKPEIAALNGAIEG